MQFISVILQTYLQTTMATQSFNKERFGAECYEWAQGTSLDTRLRNALYHLMHVQPTLLANPDTPRHVLKEPLTYIRKAQVLRNYVSYVSIMFTTFSHLQCNSYFILFPSHRVINRLVVYW